MNKKCLIVDDEKLARELLESYVRKIPYLEVAGMCGTAIEAMKALQSGDIDIMLLDIQMPDLTGLELLKMIKNPPMTILTTAYSEYALEGFELDVVDYLVKPIEFERFFKAISKCMDRAEQQTPQVIVQQQSTSKQDSYIFIKSDQKIHRVELADILYIEALQKYIRIYTKKEKLITLLSLSKVMESLPAAQFVRIHRSYIVNLNNLDNIEGNMVRIGTHTLPISKGQKEGFMELVFGKGI